MNLPLLIPIAFKNPNATGDANTIILAGDIGGTKANMRLSRFSATGLETIKEARYVSKDYASFTDILSNFLEGQPCPQKICFSVAGPIVEGKVKFTNLSWNISSEEIRNHVTGSVVAILNDLESTAYGLAGLKEDELSTIYKGTNETPGNIAILAAGSVKKATPALENIDELASPPLVTNSIS